MTLTEFQRYRVLVTGSRDWEDRTAVYSQLDDLLREHGRLTVIHGACPSGADEIAAEWLVRAYRVSELGIAKPEPHPADWRPGGVLDRSAGFRRNAEMVEAGADVCLAFIRPCALPSCRNRKPHGTHGATHCADLAEKAGIPVRRFTDA